MPARKDGGKTPVKVKRKQGGSSVGQAISRAGKGKDVSFGKAPRPRANGVSANAGVGAPAKGRIVAKKNPRTAADPHPTPKLKRAGVLPGTVGVRLSPAGKTAVAPVLKTLDILARPAYATFNAQKQAIKNQQLGERSSVVKAAGEGLSGKEKTTGSDVLKQAGVKNKTVRAIGGTALDFTVAAGYPGARGGSLAESGAELVADKAARQTFKKALKKGLTPMQARNLSHIAARQAEKEAGKRRGVWIGVGYGKHGQIRVAKRTDRTIMGNPREPSKVGTAIANKARSVVHEVRPMVRKDGRSSLKDHQRVQDIQREQRGISQRSLRDAQERYDALEKAVPARHRATVMNALDTNSLKNVPEELHDTVLKLRAAYRYRARMRRRAGMGGDVTRTVRLPRVAPDTNATRQALADARKAERAARSAERKAGKRVARARVREAEARGVAKTKVTPKDRQALATFLAEHEGQHPLSQARREMNAARKERDNARKGFGNRARYNNQGLYDTEGAAARKSSAEAKFLAAKAKHDAEYQRLMDKADREFAKKQAGEEHDPLLASLGRGDRASLESYASRASDVAGEQAVFEAARARAADPKLAEAVTAAEKRHAAETVAQKDYRRRVTLRRGDTGTRPKGYVPHVLEKDLLQGNATDPFAAQGKPRTVQHSRKIHRTIEDHNSRVPAEERFATDLPSVHANYEIQQGRLAAARHGAIEARDVGRPLPQLKPKLTVTRGVARKTKTKGHVNVRPPKKTLAIRYDTSAVKSHESIVHVGDTVRPLTKDEVKALARGDMRGLPSGGQYRVMSTDHALQLTRSPAETASKWARTITRPWKTVATATPQFQLRNLVGDEARVFDAGVPVHSIPRLNKDAVSTIKFMREHGATFEGVPEGGVVNLGKSGTLTQKQWVKELEDNGIVQSGIRTGELTHMGGDRMKLYGAKADVAESSMPRVSAATQAFKDIWRAAGDEAGHPLHALSKLFQDRENMTYISLYKHFREKGYAPRPAARKTMDALIDYGNITDTERMLRNSLFPFYTFQSRVVPFYAKTLLQRPGKIASYELLRQELGKRFGMPADDLMMESMYRQRLAGFPIAGKWVSDGLPFAQGLNELPVSLSVADYAKELFRYTTGSAAPWVKALPELAPVVYGAPGFNFFFEAPLESPNHRYVAAPVVPGVPWDKMPESTRKRLGVKQIEMRDGSLVWAWRGWKSYVLNIATPGAPGFALRAGQEVNRRGQNKQQQWLGFLTGVKVDNPDKVSAALGNAYSRRDLLEGARGDLALEPGGKKTPQYQKLNKQIRDLNRLIYALSKKRGDKTPLGVAPPKVTLSPSSLGPPESSADNSLGPGQGAADGSLGPGQ